MFQKYRRPEAFFENYMTIYKFHKQHSPWENGGKAARTNAKEVLTKPIQSPSLIQKAIYETSAQREFIYLVYSLLLCKRNNGECRVN